MKSKKCDGKMCDLNAVPCYFAKQVIYSLQCEVRDADEAFHRGILVALGVLHLFDSHTLANEIAETAGGIEKLSLYAEKGSKVDKATLKWIKTNKKAR